MGTAETYSELFNRNWPIIPKSVQGQISQMKIAVAGCGSTGGAFIEGATRLGITYYHLADNGSYELSNLNRQMVTQDEIGLNKAIANSKKILKINEHATTKCWDQGLTPENIDAFLDGVDFLFDAVDVTTPSGIQMKLLLHEKAAQKKIPTGSALDLAYTQWLKSYNYHLGEQALHGRLAEARKINNPLKSLIVGFASIEEMPLEISDEIIRLMKNPNESACQLACACFLLAGMVTPYLISFVKTNRLPPLTAIDLIGFFETSEEKAERKRKTSESHAALRQLLLELN